jgi:hypothetical protein
MSWHDGDGDGDGDERRGAPRSGTSVGDSVSTGAGTIGVEAVAQAFTVSPGMVEAHDLSDKAV